MLMMRGTFLALKEATPGVVGGAGDEMSGLLLPEITLGEQEKRAGLLVVVESTE